MEFDKNVIDSYGHDIKSTNQMLIQTMSSNLYQWIKSKLSKSDNRLIYSLVE